MPRKLIRRVVEEEWIEEVDPDEDLDEDEGFQDEEPGRRSRHESD